MYFEKLLVQHQQLNEIAYLHSHIINILSARAIYLPTCLVLQKQTPKI